MSDYDPFAPKESREDADRRKLITQQQQADDVQWLMGDPRGRRLMWAWLEFCGLRRTPYAGDNNRTNFNLGVQNVGLMLEASILAHAPEQWLTMSNEAREERRAHSAEK